jgi:hypothetical protein
MKYYPKKLIAALTITIFGIMAGVYVTPQPANANIPADCANEFCDPGKGCKEVSLSWDCSGEASNCDHQNCGT